MYSYNNVIFNSILAEPHWVSMYSVLQKIYKELHDAGSATGLFKHPLLSIMTAIQSITFILLYITALKKI